MDAWERRRRRRRLELPRRRRREETTSDVVVEEEEWSRTKRMWWEASKAPNAEEKVDEEEGWIKMKTRMKRRKRSWKTWREIEELEEEEGGKDVVAWPKKEGIWPLDDGRDGEAALGICRRRLQTRREIAVKLG